MIAVYVKRFKGLVYCYRKHIKTTTTTKKNTNYNKNNNIIKKKKREDRKKESVFYFEWPQVEKGFEVKLCGTVCTKG